MTSHDTTWHEWHQMTSHDITLQREYTLWGAELSNLQVLRVWSRLAQPVHEIPMGKNNNKGPIGQCNTYTPSFPLSRVLYKCESSTASVLRWTLPEKVSSLPLLSASIYVDFDVTHLLKFPRLFCVSGYYLASFPGSCAWAEKKEPGTHCLRMLSPPRISGNLEISCKTCSVTLTSARHTNFSGVKDACHWLRSVWTMTRDVLGSLLAGIVYTFVHNIPAKRFGTWLTQSFSLKFTDHLEQSNANCYRQSDTVFDFKIMVNFCLPAEGRTAQLYSLWERIILV